VNDHPPLAFVDVETTGLDPRVNRIAEIGVVTVDGSAVSEWTSFVAPRSGDPSRHPRASSGSGYFASAPAPSFADIAVELQQRLHGRILIAHNARFDYGFLTAEFQRVRLELDCRVLCTVMLSRKLFPQQIGHDLDTLMHCHDLARRSATGRCRTRDFSGSFGRSCGAKEVARRSRAPFPLCWTDPSSRSTRPRAVDRLPDAPGGMRSWTAAADAPHRRSR
jgi:DNA polymerase-3 subunit epsilon